MAARATVHGERAEWRSNRRREYWKSRLHCHGETRGSATKHFTHRKERRQSRRIEWWARNLGEYDA